MGPPAGAVGRQMRTEILPRVPAATRATTDTKSTGVASHSCYQTGLYNYQHYTACYLVNCLALLARSLGLPRVAMASASTTHQRPALLILEACPAEPVLDLSGDGLLVDDALACRRTDAGGMALVFETDSDFADHPREAMSSLNAGGARPDENTIWPNREHTRFVVADHRQGFCRGCGSVCFLEFFWNFFGSREVHGTDDFDFGFGFTEFKSRRIAGRRPTTQSTGPTAPHSLKGSNPTTCANATG